VFFPVEFLIADLQAHFPGIVGQGIRPSRPAFGSCELLGMDLRCCRFCQKLFQPSRFHREQAVCSDQPCQRQRRSQSRSRKFVLDAEYRETCRDSARKWRANHRGYWKQYRAAKPESAQRNRVQQNRRDLRQRLAGLANNNSALDLKSSVAAVWWLGPAAADLADLANNNLASTQVFILQRAIRKPPLREASCKQHPSGVTASLA
jgi:hypothetical protein